MKLKNKTTLLAAAIALASVSYLPSASASTLLSLTNDDSVGYASKIYGTGAFTDFFDFKVNGSAFSINATGNSTTFSGLSKGTELYSFNLYDALHTNVIETGVVTSTGLDTGWAFSSKFSKSPLLENTVYSIGVTGFEHSTKGSYSASFTVSPVSAVPLPGAVWMMLTGMIGLLGYQARNKKTA